MMRLLLALLLLSSPGWAAGTKTIDDASITSDGSGNISIDNSGELLGLPGTPSATGASSKEYVDGHTPAAHASSHENGGGDEISVAGLSGTLADAQTPTAHASSHQNGGGDEVATATPAANAIPKADGSGDLDAWITSATNAVPGIMEFATQTETNTGVSTLRAVSPGTLSATTLSFTADGLETASTVVVISAAAAPSDNDVLVATSSTAGEWQWGPDQTLGTVQTTDATVTTVASFTTATGAAYLGKVMVVAQQTNVSNAYELTFRFENVGGTVNIGLVQTDYTSEDDADWDVTIDASGTSLRVRVTGEAATTIDWTAVLRVMTGL